VTQPKAATFRQVFAAQARGKTAKLQRPVMSDSHCLTNVTCMFQFTKKITKVMNVVTDFVRNSGMK